MVVSVDRAEVTEGEFRRHLGFLGIAEWGER